MTDKITDLERAVVDAAMEYVKIHPGRTFDLAQACRAVSEARAALEPVPGEAEAWAECTRNNPFANSWLHMVASGHWLVTAFRAALRIAIKANREARDG